MPTIQRETNYTVVQVGIITFWFSYDTCIAFQVQGQEPVVRQNVWGATTGKHLNRVSDDKANRVDKDTFERLYKQVFVGIHNGVTNSPLFV